MAITYSTAVTRSKLSSYLPLAYTLSSTGGYNYKFRRCAELTIPDLLPGDFVHVGAAGQASTNGTITRAMHARYLKATKTNSDSHTEGVLLARPMGTNVTDLIHHSMLTADGSFVATPTFSGIVKVIFVMYAANLSKQPTDSRSLIVDYVDLRADVVRQR